MNLWDVQGDHDVCVCIYRHAEWSTCRTQVCHCVRHAPWDVPVCIASAATDVHNLNLKKKKKRG